MDIGKVHIAQDLGKFAERIASEEYVKRGYAILERNYRCGKSEIDLIARKDNVIVLIEVKARSGKDQSPIEAITRDKKRRMMRTADSYIMRVKGDCEYRFDFFTLTGDKENYTFEILEDAFVAADFF